MGLKRKTPLRAKSKPSKQRKAMPKVNAKRKKKRHAEAFGPPGFADFVRAYGCVVGKELDGPASCSGPIEAAHVRSRGAGGGWRNNVVGLCRLHHAEQHSMGARTFDKCYETDLDLWACAITGLWEQANNTGEVHGS